MQTKKLKYLLLFAVIAIAAAVAWYFAYWVKTPQYSLGLIGSAVQKHDFAAFEKHAAGNRLEIRICTTFSILTPIAIISIPPVAVTSFKILVVKTGSSTPASKVKVP